MRHQTDNNSHTVPWKTTKDMYESIDSISVGRVGWMTYERMNCHTMGQNQLAHLPGGWRRLMSSM
jgi:hypothetical protein